LSSADQTTDAVADLETFEVLTDGRSVRLQIDERLYPLDAVRGAAYLFLDRCFVRLDRPADQRIDITLKTKAAPAPGQLEQLAGELGNALLDQAVRVQVAQSTGKIREYIMARAFFAAPAQSSIDQLLAELDAEELADDPLDIQVPWEKGGA
jgi:His-Xaa-Ser system protein HxsD